MTQFLECEFVQFLDGDCILQPQWVPSALAFLQARPDVAVVCGRRFEADPQASIYNDLCDQEWNTPVGEATECGGDALVRCVALDQVDGYNSGLQAGEEPEMTARMRAAGWRIWRIDVPMTEHDANMRSLGQWWRRTQRGGFGFAQVWSITKALPQRLYGRQLRSALVWAIVVPLLVVLATITMNQPVILLVASLAYGLQLLRIARNCRGDRKLVKAALILLAKIPEAIGAARFLSRDAAAFPSIRADDHTARRAQYCICDDALSAGGVDLHRGGGGRGGAARRPHLPDRDEPARNRLTSRPRKHGSVSAEASISKHPRSEL